VNWIHLVQDMNLYQGFVNMITNFGFVLWNLRISPAIEKVLEFEEAI
jgi:hypothetical protein